MEETGIEVTESCGNIFADLGLPNAEELLAKADAALRIRQLIQEMGLPEKDAAKRMGVTQRLLSQILSGDLEEFTLGQLFRCLNALDQDVQIIIKPKPAGRERGQVIVGLPA